MSNRFRTTICLAAAIFVSFISSASAASLEEIKKRGYMVVATEDDYPPFEYVVNGKPMGYDHALLAILRKSAPFEIRPRRRCSPAARPRSARRSFRGKGSFRVLPRGNTMLRCLQQ